MQRAGNRRYYRPEDVALARRIHQLLNRDGYTVRGVQNLLSSGSEAAAPPPAAPAPATDTAPSVDLDRLRTLRNRLVEALDA